MKMIDCTSRPLNTQYTLAHCVWTRVYVRRFVCVAGPAGFSVCHKPSLNSIILSKDQMGSGASSTYIKEAAFNDMFNDSSHRQMGFIWNLQCRQEEAFSPPIRGILWKTDSLFRARVFFFFFDGERRAVDAESLMSDSGWKCIKISRWENIFNKGRQRLNPRGSW